MKWTGPACALLSDGASRGPVKDNAVAATHPGRAIFQGQICPDQSMIPPGHGCLPLPVFHEAKKSTEHESCISRWPN